VISKVELKEIPPPLSEQEQTMPKPPKGEPTLRAIDTDLMEALKEEERVNEESESDLYEISGEKIWDIKGVKRVDGLFTIFEIRDFKEKGKLKDNSFLRKGNEWWKRYTEHYELHITLEVMHLGDQKRICIKKESIRLPFNHLVNIMIKEHAVAAEIINISLRGCQIKIPTNMKYLYEIDEQFTINFDKSSELNGKSIEAIVRRVEQNPTGFTWGIQFIEMDESTKEILNSIINGLISDMNLQAA
jgi:hypothetical protein